MSNIDGLDHCHSRLEDNVIRSTTVFLLLLGVIALPCFAADNQPAPKSNQGAMVIVFKDGHRQTIRMSDVSRIEFATPDRAQSVQPPSNPITPGRNYFTGKWEVGDGSGRRFVINLKENGDAEKSLGAAHGTWTLVNGEAQITWDDGWHDAIRKVGSKHEKFAYEPGTSFSDKPHNVTEARSLSPKPL